MYPVLDSLHAQRTALLDEIDTIARAVAEGDGRDLSDTESNVIARAQSRIDGELDPQIETWTAIERTRAAHETRAPVVYPSPTPTFDDRGADLVYRSFAEYARDALICRYDQIAQRAGGTPARQGAEERISRAVAHTTSTDVAGLIRPQYLDQIAQLIDKSRPVVASARSVNLTSGKLTYPSITQKPIVGKQTAEKTEAPSQTMTVAFLDVIADTYVGAGNISWQAINWSTPDALSLWFDLAAEQYAIQTEAATGTVVAAATPLATPAVPATPTLADWMAALTAAAARSTRRPGDVRTSSMPTSSPAIRSWDSSGTSRRFSSPEARSRSRRDRGPSRVSPS